MAGIYQRDNLNLAAAIDSAIRNRMAFEQREAERRNEMVKAGSNAAMALGRTAEMAQQDDEALLAKLQKEREEAVAQEQYEKQVAQRNAVNDYLYKNPIEAKYNAQVEQRNAVNDFLFQKGLRAGANPYLRELSSTGAMSGYEPQPTVVVPNYAEAMARRGVYLDPKHDFDGVI